MNDHFEQRVAPGGAGAQGLNATATVHNHYGTRPHAIEEFPSAAPPDTRWLMAQPSRLLDARSQVVPFTGRDTELRRLREWRDSGDTGMSVLLLHAPAGQGKTRLAAEFAARSLNQEALSTSRPWRVLQARLGGAPGSHVVGNSEPAGGEAGLLLVVDYADRWAHSELVRLLTDPLLRGQEPVRVLLVGRTVRWYAPLRGELDELHVGAEDFLLPPLSDGRLSMFAAARDRFAQPDLYDLPDAARVQPPASLAHQEFGLALTLHMAALAAVDAHVGGRRAPGAPHELSAYLLDREYRAWQRLFDAGREGQDYRTRPSVMAKAVFTATLIGAVGHEAGVEAMRALDVPGHPQDLLLDHRFCYPPTSQDDVLEPLYPDRLAEDFLALLTPGHDITAYDPDPWATAVPATLLSREGRLRTAIAARAVPVLAAAAGRWPHLRENVLHPLLIGDPDVALDGGSAALSALADMSDIDPAVLDAVDAAITARVGDERHVDLDVGIAAIAERVTLRPVDDNAGLGLIDHALRWTRLSWRMANAGQPVKALAAAENAVEFCRANSQLHSDAQGAFAESLANLGSRLGALGRWDEALAATDEALGLFRQLAGSDPDTYQYDLAATLSNIGAHLSGLGRRREALARAEEAHVLFRRLADADPDAHLPHLAASLTSLGATLDENGRVREAVAATTEAVGIWRRLCDANPDAYLPDLATSLANLGRQLSSAGRHEAAFAATEEAVAIRRRAAGANPDAHLSGLAGSLGALGALSSVQVRPREDQASTEETVSLYRRLAEGDPDTYLPRLVEALTRHATELAGLGQHERACPLIAEVVSIQRRLTDSYDQLFHLASSLDLLWRELSALGRHQEAVEAAEEVVTVHRRMAADGPGGFMYSKNLANSLGTLGSVLAAAGHSEQALTAADEAVDILHHLIDTDHDFLRSDWVRALSHRSVLQVDAGKWQDALFFAGLAVSFFYSRTVSDQRKHEPDLNASMKNLRRVLSTLSSRLDALEVVGWAVNLYQRLERDKGDAYEPCVVSALREYARIRASQGIEIKKSLTSALAVAQTFSKLAQRLPGVFTTDLDLAEDAAADVFRAVSRSVGEPDDMPQDAIKDLIRVMGGFGGQRQKAAADESPPKFGCVTCYGQDAETTWQNFSDGYQLEATLAAHSHFGVSLIRCRACTQVFVSIFTEFIDWINSEDAQYWRIMPVTAAEAAALTDHTLDVHEVGALSENRRHLNVDWPPEAEQAHVYWNSHRFQVVEGH